MKTVSNPTDRSYQIQHAGALYVVAPGDNEMADDVARHAQRKLKAFGVRLNYGGTSVEAPPPESGPSEPVSVAVKRARQRAAAPAPEPIVADAPKAEPTPAAPEAKTKPKKTKPSKKGGGAPAAVEE